MSEVVDAEASAGCSLVLLVRHDISSARAYARVGAIATIRRAMPEDWKAAAFYLERTDPQNWGRSTRHEHSGPEGGPIRTEDTAGAIDPRRLTREQRAALREMLDAQTDCVEG